MNILEYISDNGQGDKVICDKLRGEETAVLPIILWGMGEVAEYMYNYLTKNGFGIAGVYVNTGVKKEMFNGVTVYNSIEDIGRKYPLFNIVVGHLRTDDKYNELEQNESVKGIYYFEPSLLYEVELIGMDFVKNHREGFSWTYEQLSDARSRDSYLAYLNAKINRTNDGLLQYLCGPQYFCNDIIQWDEHEVFVDCGAYTGDTVRSFVNELKNRSIDEYDAIHAFEPDGNNYTKLLTLSGSLPKLKPYRKGVGDHPGKVSFIAEGTMMSMVADTGNVTIETDTLDNVLRGQRVTFIKMDVEGYEMNALKGAADIIKKNRPKLAISAYHKANDLIEIPRYLKSLVSGYKFYFRLHKYGAIDAVLYAVCNEPI